MNITFLRKKFSIPAILVLGLSLFAGMANAQIINTICGTGSATFSGDGGSALVANLNVPVTVATDVSGNLYIADNTNNRIRKITLSTGIVSTVAGNGSMGFSGDGGPATAASFSTAAGIWVDGSGNLYLADRGNNRVRMVNTSGVINTIAGTGTGSFSGDGGAAVSATLNWPGRVCVDGSGNIYISDRLNYRIRKINTSGVISTFAGNGSSGFSGDGGAATSARISEPFFLQPDAAGNIYLADMTNYRVRIINTSGVINTYAGSGSATFSGDGGAATSAGIRQPYGLGMDAAGNLYIGDNYTAVGGDDRIRIVNPSGVINTFSGLGYSGFSGDGGLATAAVLYAPSGLVARRNALYIADQFNSRLRRIGFTNTTPPSFTSGATANLTVCINSSATSIATQLAVLDSEEYQKETWSIYTGPSNGTLSGFSTSWLSNGAVVLPSSVTYTPTSGYSGSDAFQIIVTDDWGAQDTIQVNVTVSPLPYAGTITGSSTVCTGTTSALSESVSGGTWSSSATSIATVGTTGIVTGVSSGTVTISYTVTNSCGSSVATFAMSVNVTPNPGTITGASTFCESATITLTDAATGGTWSSSDGTVATVGTTTGIVYGVSPGTATISYTVTTACGSASATHNITVNPMPAAITGTAAVCEGGSVTTLSETSTGGTWSSSAAGTATVNSTGVVTGVSAGTVNISYVFSTGCGVFVNVTVNPLPGVIAGPASVCSGSTITLTNSATGGSWTSATTSVATINASGVLTGVSNGTSVITYTLPTGCLATRTITVNAVPATITGSSTVCENSTTPLSTASTGGTWSSSATSIATVVAATGVVTGVSAGSVTITYTAGGGCYNTMAMTVNPLPAAISGATSVCEGAAITLTNASGSGTWTSSSAARATVGTSSGVVTGVSAGTVNITFALSTGCLTSTTLTVITTPSAITGTPVVCTNSSIILGNSASGGTWSSATTSIATATTAGASTGSITGVTAGTAIISYSISGCAATVSVTVNPQPGAVITPLGDTMLCPGGFVVLASSTGASYTYQWYNGTTAISGSTDDYFVTSSAAGYHVNVTNTYGCTSSSSTMAVTVNPATAAITYSGPTTICSSSSATLNATTGAGLSYQWMLGGTSIAGATGATYAANTNGSYNVIVSNSIGCTATSSSFALTVIPAPSGTLMLTGPLSFCNGDSVIITADSAAGYTYQWTLGGVNIAGAINFNYTAMATGNYQVVVTNSYPCSTNSAVAAVTAMALPSATISVSGSSTFCAGGSASLSVPASAGNTYQWYRNGTLITGATTANYTATIGGNYTTRVTTPAGCGNVTFPSFLVTELSTPMVVALSSTSFCWGGSAVLGTNITSSTGVTYQWKIGTTDISGATNSTYAAGTSGTYSCEVNISGGCIATATPVTVVQHPLPNPVVTYDGLVLRTGNFYVSYQWFRNLTPLSAVFPFYTPSDTGSYTVRVIDTFGCQSISTAYVLSRIGGSRTLGISGVGNTEISVYPNPTQGIVHIASSEPLRAVVTAIDGRRILEQNNATEINITTLAEGIYTLMLYNAEGQMVRVEKLVKE